LQIVCVLRASPLRSENPRIRAQSVGEHWKWKRCDRCRFVRTPRRVA
jgi:hypothetical protein